MYANSVLVLLGGTAIYSVDTHFKQMRGLCYDLLPVQYTKLTHQKTPSVYFSWSEVTTDADYWP